MDELSRVLSVERRLLEFLLFKLVEGRHLLAAREGRFLPYAAAEVQRAMERVQVAELRRSILMHDLAVELDVSEGALTLGALARDSIEPFRTIFADHHLAFLELAAEIDEVSRCLAGWAGRVDTIEPGVEGPDTADSVMDQQMAEQGYQALLAAVSRLPTPSLVELLQC
jgi:hypothetical protein